MRWLFGIKIILYSLVFIRIFQKTPVSFPLISIALILLISGFWRSLNGYAKSKINIFTLLFDLFFAFLCSLISKSGNFDKLFILYLTEGTAVLPKPYFVVYAIVATAVSMGSTTFYDFRVSGQVQLPGIADLLLYAFIFVLVLSERRQREQRHTYEKLTKELKLANLQLKETVALSENLASEAERRRLAGEVHDGLGHNLTGLILTLEAGKKLMSHDVEAGKTSLDKALKISRTALNSVRELVSTRRDANSGFELNSQLEAMVQDIEELTGLKIDLDIKIRDIVLSHKEQFNLYRIFQEAITNTLRHADADHAQICISNDNEFLYFSYIDNGSGANRIQKGNGLRGMEHRISDIGGSINFQSQAGLGITIKGYVNRRGNENEEAKNSNCG